MQTMQILWTLAKGGAARGAGVGAITGVVLTLTFVFTTAEPHERGITLAFVGPLAMAMWALVGVLFGVAMGLFIGAVLAFELRQHTLPLTNDDFATLRRAGEIGCVLATLGALAGLVFTLQFTPTSGIYSIAGVAVLLAVAYWLSRRGVRRFLDTLPDTLRKAKGKRKSA